MKLTADNQANEQGRPALGKDTRAAFYECLTEVQSAIEDALKSNPWLFSKQTNHSVVDQKETLFEHVRELRKSLFDERGTIPLVDVPPVLLAECRNHLRQIAAASPGFDSEWEKKTRI